MLQADHLPHAFMFAGIEGIGKKLTAFALVKALNCLEQTGDACCRCLSCRKIDKLMHPDVHVVEPEKEIIKIDQVLSLQQTLAYKPMEGRMKAVIIDRADTMNLHAANCLLKTLEEPPPQTVLILIVGEAAGMLPTILSRCQRINFYPLNDETVRELLVAAGVDETAAADIIMHARGSLQRAHDLLDSDYLQRRSMVVSMLVGQQTSGRAQLLDAVQQLVKDKEGLPIMLEFMLEWYRDVAMIKAGVADELLYNADVREQMHSASAGLSLGQAMQKANRVIGLQQMSRFNVDMQLGLESLMLS
ncbi:MAG: DNA polymerase III subunit delta' [Deltaproteobacteria bacterium]|nr:DNA polymerase III subunit delta' [Deltaproteobacteria bacterium]